MLDDSGVEPSLHFDVLDAGCGTGLCGAILAPFARRLVGVDLSEGMLAHAKAKNVYHELVKAELGGLLRAMRERQRGRRAAEQRDELAPPDAKCHLIPPA
jgi:predicted TPR repeat methyltransferase